MGRFHATAATLLLLLSPAAALRAQAPEAGVPTLTIQSQLVLVPTEVRTKKGETIFGLHADDFTIEADGVPQRVRLEQTDTPVPLSLVVLVQCSRSAFREGPKIQGLSTMVDAIVGGAPAQVALVDFGKQLEMLTNLTPDPAAREKAFSELQPCDDDPGDAVFDALAFANGLLDHRHAAGRRVILLVSETRDHGSKVHAATVVEALNRSNTVVDSVAFSPGREDITEDLKTSDGATGGVIGLGFMAFQALRKNAPKELARETGGEYINFGSENAFDRGLNTLANRVHNAYQLSFVPHFPPGSPAAAPGLHTLKVQVTNYPDAILRHRESYWSTTP